MFPECRAIQPRTARVLRRIQRRRTGPRPRRQLGKQRQGWQRSHDILEHSMLAGLTSSSGWSRSGSACLGARVDIKGDKHGAPAFEIITIQASFPRAPSKRTLGQHGFQGTETKRSWKRRICRLTKRRVQSLHGYGSHKSNAVRRLHSSRGKGEAGWVEAYKPPHRRLAWGQAS